MEEPRALRLAMGSLSVLPGVAPVYAAAVSASGGSVPTPTAAAILAVAVGATHAVFWLASIPVAARWTVAVSAVPLTLAAVTCPGAAGGAFLLWAYPAVMVGFAAPPRFMIPAIISVGAIAVAGLSIAAVVAGRAGSAVFVCVEAAVVISLAGSAAGA